MYTFLSLAVAAAQAACPEPLTAARFGLLVDDAEHAYERLDQAGFTTATDTLVTRLPCLSEAPDRALAARYHRLTGLRVYLLHDETRASEAFAAARRLEPAAGLPTELVPEQHPLRKLYVATPVDSVRLTAAPRPADGALLFDGTPGTDRPSLPTLFQWRAEDGGVRTTAYLWPEDPLPAYPIAPSHRRRDLWIGAAAGGAAALALYAGAAATYAEYENLETPRESLGGLRTRMGVLNGAAIGVGVLAGGTAVVALAAPAGR